jgi:hypothetical protein
MFWVRISRLKESRRVGPPTRVVLLICTVGGATRGHVLGKDLKIKESRRVGPPTRVVLLICNVGGATRGDVLGKDFKIKRIAPGRPSYKGGAFNLYCGRRDSRRCFGQGFQD